MNKKIFRKASTERLKSPEQLNDYIKAASPAAWVILVTIIALLVAAYAWIYFGCIYTRVSGVAINEDGVESCYVRVEDMIKADSEVTVTIGGDDFKVSEISEEPFKLNTSEKVSDKLIATIGGFKEDDWIVKLTLDGHRNNPKSQIEVAVVTIEEIKPSAFLEGGGADE